MIDTNFQPCKPDPGLKVRWSRLIILSVRLQNHGATDGSARAVIGVTYRPQPVCESASEQRPMAASLGTTYNRHPNRPAEAVGCPYILPQISKQLRCRRTRAPVRRHRHRSHCSGWRRASTKSFRKDAARAPSTTRWSQEIVNVIIGRIAG